MEFRPCHQFDLGNCFICLLPKKKIDDVFVNSYIVIKIDDNTESASISILQMKYKIVYEIVSTRYVLFHSQRILFLEMYLLNVRLSASL